MPSASGCMFTNEKQTKTTEFAVKAFSVVIVLCSIPYYLLLKASAEICLLCVVEELTDGFELE